MTTPKETETYQGDGGYQSRPVRDDRHDDEMEPDDGGSTSSLGPSDVQAVAADRTVRYDDDVDSIVVAKRRYPSSASSLPVGRLLQKYAVVVIAGSSILLLIDAVRRDTVRHATTLLVAAAATALIAAYLSMLITPSAVSRRPERIRDMHCIGWMVAVTMILGRLFVSSPSSWWLVVVLSLLIAASLLCLRRGDDTSIASMDIDADGQSPDAAIRPFWSTARGWTSLALAMYWFMLILFSWALPRVTDGGNDDRTHTMARVVLAMLAMYPLVYLASSTDTRDGWFAVLDASVVGSVVWLSRA